MVAPARASQIHPTEADFEEHTRDLADLAVVRARKAWLSMDSPEREILDAREAHIGRRIRAWVDRFTRADPVEAHHTSSTPGRQMAQRSEARWEGRATSR